MCEHMHAPMCSHTCDGAHSGSHITMQRCRSQVPASDNQPEGDRLKFQRLPAVQGIDPLGAGSCRGAGLLQEGRGGQGTWAHGKS